MKFVEEYRNPELAKKLLDRIHRCSTRPIRLMEFCGGHTVSIFKHGIRQLLPKTIEMLSGPGCPICVTANADLDKAIALGRLPNAIITSFGDMIRVPGSYSTLQQAKAEGCDVRVVYSVQDALYIARDNPDKSVIFIGIGFETTAPTVAAAILEAEQEKINNFYILSLHKVCPPIMKSILDLGEVRLDGIICPGHVSAIIGSKPYEFIARDYHIACAVSGFEPLDILLGIDRLVDQVETKQYKVEIAYRRGVKPEGNQLALKLMDKVFEVSEANWRGIGIVPASGLSLRKEYERFDAEANFAIDAGPSREVKGCLCGSILRGVSSPLDCRLFRVSCTPEHPVGPCMVSSEGSCATYYHYGETYGG
ncbi:MAG: hydrogenase formation protein HypD [Chloroflexi bacterium]|nr:hydrogenase formation protein HypD [Chloroflexota bacterium]